MFHKHNDTYIDLSIDMRDPDDWNVGTLRSFHYPLNITALATEPISRLLAVGTTFCCHSLGELHLFAGTAGGIVYVFGGPGVETRLNLPEPVGVKFVHFATSSYKLLCMGM
jgi:syntaxin-binding protein 5